MLTATGIGGGGFPSQVLLAASLTLRACLPLTATASSHEGRALLSLSVDYCRWESRVSGWMFGRPSRGAGAAAAAVVAAMVVQMMGWGAWAASISSRGACSLAAATRLGPSCFAAPRVWGGRRTVVTAMSRREPLEQGGSSRRTVAGEPSGLARRGVMRRWWVGLGLWSWAASLSGLLGGASAAETTKGVSSVGEGPAKSGLGLDLSPLPRHEVEERAAAFSKVQQKVLLEAGTERPGSGKTVNGYGSANKEDGVWVSAVSGVPLFDSHTKYDSGTGWPSFFSALDPAHVIERVDPRDQEVLPSFLWRIEVLDRKSGTHLGHVFDDGPRPTGKRYCMNASSLRFVPRSEYQAWLDKLPKEQQQQAK